jgi:tetratricopeptide (TPR) repeat protein/predicted Ser/Thr protein kinase
MACPDANLIAAFIGGTLDPVRAEELAGHIDGCGACDELVTWSMRAALSPTARAPSAAGADAADLRPRGSVFGRYVLLELVGSGGMGRVYAAFDPKLDRKVALKLVWDEAAAARAGIEREARLAARLQHPNVIAIYDVGAVDDRLYLAMEYVDGVTLADWIRGPARPPRDVLGVFLQAARGLVAAHGAGLVHRDFKPSNVLVGRDGRVRVLDFGLARAVDDAPAAAVSYPRGVVVEGSVAGLRAGTPAYMAPEQHRGEPAGAAADQFAFCVALHEALHGTRPFAGDSLDVLAGSVLAGRVVDPPPGSRVPPWLRRVILRGLSVDPQARFPSMEALVAALGRDPTRARRTWIAVAAVVGVAGLALAGHARTVEQRAAVCRGHEQRMVALVGPDRALRVRAAFASTGASFAATSADRSLAALDRYARTLGRSYRETCAAGGPELDSRVACYEERAAELGGLVEVYTSADRIEVARAISAAGTLTPVATCEEARAAARPDGATPDLARRVAQVRALDHAGRLTAASDEARRVLGDARGRGDRRHEVDALVLLGRIELAQSKPAAATTLSQAIEVGEANGRDAEVEIALELLAFDSAQRAHDYAAAHRLQRLAAAKVARTGRADSRAGDVMAIDGMILQMEGRPRDAEAALRQAVALQEKVYGADSPIVEPTLDRLAIVLGDQGRDAEALALDERAAAIRDATFGPEHPRLIDGLVDLAGSLGTLGRYDEALARLRRADDIALHAFGADSAQRFNTLDNIGLLEKARHNYDAAETSLKAALAIARTALGPSSEQTGEVLSDLGELYAARGQPAEGAAYFERALPIVEHALGAEHRQVADILLDLGLADLDLHRADQAVALLERALRLRSEDTPARAAPIRFALARALWDAARDRPRAIALARQASGTSLRRGEGVTQEDISAWLAVHDPH